MSSDIQLVISQDFPEEQHEIVRDVLDWYGDQDYQRDPIRVRLAALKLADGDLGELKEMINAARVDYRDILSWAEYPNELDRSLGRNKMTRGEADMADRKQMKDWRVTHGLA